MSNPFKIILYAVIRYLKNKKTEAIDFRKIKSFSEIWDD